MQLFCNTGIGAEHFELRIAPAPDALLELSLAGQLRFRLGSAHLDGFDENGSLTDKCRVHSADDGLSGEFELRRTIPFGGEYRLTRRMECASGFVRISDDFAPSTGAVRDLELEDASWIGPWKKLVWLSLNDGKLVRHEAELGDDERVFYHERDVLVMATLFAADGACVELGAGNDLWRHAAAGELPGAEGEFVLSGSAAQMRLRRRIFQVADKETVVAPRPWRLKYYVAWHDGKSASAALPESVFSPVAAELPDHCANNDGGLCLAAAPVRRLLREVVRRSSSDLTLRLPEPGCCSDAGHMERPGKEALSHWDVEEFMELYLWGNRTLGKRGLRLAVDFPGSGALAAALRLGGGKLETSSR